MQIDNPNVREAYKRGAHAAVDSAYEWLPGDALVALEDWLQQLDAWEGGQPPAPPPAWRMITS